VDAFDAFKREAFKLKAALMWTINDFPAYANLSGWTNKGYYACPSCAQSTHSLYLPCGRKICYMGHRRWLPDDHPFRLEADLFDGTIETRQAPSPISGSIILREQERISFNYGKSKKASKKRTRDDTNTSAQLLDDVENSNEIEEFDDDPEVVLEEDQRSTIHELLWKKRSIFFDLEYWEHNDLRHNLDVMHIEKNVCDNLLGTFLNLEGKSKDNEKARKDLQNMEIRAHLWLIENPNKKPYIPPAEYTMSSDDKERFLKVLKYLKVPDAYASNISRLVNLKDRKISNLKSHDNHILMQDILLIALRASGS